MKRIVASVLLALMLLGLFGCAQKHPSVEDTAPFARQMGNTYAAEQGEWIAMRSEKEGAPCILLYNKEDQKSHLIAEGNYCDIGLLENKVFYRSADGTNALYCFDLLAWEARLLKEGVADYQVQGGVVYYTAADGGNCLYTYYPEIGASREIEMSYGIDAFWQTSYGIYYFNKERHFLMVLPNDAKLDRLVCVVEGAVCDLAEVNGANIAFIETNAEGKSTLCTYKPVDKKVVPHLEGRFRSLCYVRDRAVVVHQATLCSVDLSSDKIFSWGAPENGENTQLLSDCAVTYQKDCPTIVYYARSK